MSSPFHQPAGKGVFEKDLDMLADKQSLQTHTLRQYSSARPLHGQDLEDSKAILNTLGHFLYRPTSGGPGRRYVTTSGKQIVCEGTGAGTMCRWA